MARIGLRVNFSKILNFVFLAPFFWRRRSAFFVAIDYHYFTKGTPELEDLEVEREILDRQLAFFSREFEIINPKEFSFEYAFSNKREKFAILITIDDGDDSISENLDIFEKYNIPIIIFLPIGMCLPQNSLDGLRSRVFRSFFEVEEKIRDKLCGEADAFFHKVIEMNHHKLEKFLGHLNKYKSCPDPLSSRRLLSLEKQLNLINHPLVTLSSHTMSHPILSEISPDWARWEIEVAKVYIQKIGGNTRFFAYPYGFKASYSEEIQRYLSNAGIEFAFTTRALRTKSNSNPLELGRVGMHSVYDEGYLRGLVGGVFELWDIIFRR